MEEVEMAETETLAIRLPKELSQRLTRVAKRTGRTKTYYAREAIIRHLEDIEDYYDAIQVLERNEPSIGNDDMRQIIDEMDD